MIIQFALDEIKSFQKTISQNCPSLDFNIEEVVVRPEFRGWYKEHVPNQGASKKSGVYLFSDSSGEVLYIGKAGADNLAAEIWGKFSAPRINEKSKQPEFTNSNMAKYAPNDELREKFIEGDVCVAVVVIHPKDLVSLVEVYLQTLCFRKEGKLPLLNNRIG